jgi:hypothetical protein
MFPQVKSSVNQKPPKQETTVSNTVVGLQHQEISVGIDYLSVSFPCNPNSRQELCDDLQAFLFAYANEQFDSEVKVFKGGFEGITGLLGSRIYWATERSIISTHFLFLNIPGQFWSERDKNQVHTILRGFALLGGKPSRLDLQVTVLNPSFTMEQVHDCFTSGNWVSKSRTWTVIKGATKTGITTGYTLYAGNRLSETFIRIYDKGLESGSLPPNQKIRFELESKGKLCGEIWKSLQRIDISEWEGHIKSCVLSRIDFRDLKNATSCRSNLATRYQWYEGVVGAKVVKWCIVQVKKTFLRIKAWFEDNLSPTLSMLYEGLGHERADEWVKQCLRKGEDRLKPRHYAILHQFGYGSV